MMLERFREELTGAITAVRLAAIHTRPILYNLVNLGFLPPPDLELTSIGSGMPGMARLSSTLDKPGQPTPDLVFDPEATHLPLLWEWARKNAGRGVLVAPYILYSSVFTRGAWDGFRELLHKLGIGQVCVPFENAKYIEAKENFAGILESAGVQAPRFVEGTCPKVPDWRQVRKLFGKRFVVQLTDSAGGSATRIVGVYHTEGDAEKMIKEAPGTWWRVVEYVEGYESNGQALVLPDGKVLIDPLSHKPSAGRIPLLGAKPQGACGDDWTFSWGDEVLKQYRSMMTSIGKVLWKRFSYIGIFGVDFIVDLKNGKLVPHEINARYQGTSFHHDRRALRNGRPSTFGLWLLAVVWDFLSEQKDFSWIQEDVYNDQALKETGGWQIDIWPPPELELPLPIRGDLNGRWSWDQRRQRLVHDPRGAILAFAPLPGQELTKKTRMGDPRLIPPSQVFYWPQEGGPPLPSLFHPSKEELTPFGRKFVNALRLDLYGVG